MNLSKPFILRPIATSLAMIALFFAGCMSYWLLPVSALPEVDYPVMQVSTFYPGASPDVMTTLITAPLERQLGQIPGLTQMTSNSSSGASIITLQFNLKMNLDVAEQQVQAAINAAGGFLPAGLPNPPIYSKVNPADAPILVLALTSTILKLPQLEDYAENRLSQKISQVSGVGLVSIGGGGRPAVRIQVNTAALSSYGLTLNDVQTAIQNASTNQPKGSFDGPHLSSTINANDQLITSSNYQDLIIAYRNTAPVRLGDVATVVDDKENVRKAAWVNGQPAVIINIQRQPGANVIEVVNHIESLLPKITASMPQNIDIKILTDRTNTIRASVKEAQYELLISIMLVVTVIFVFLRNFSATVIPSISVPLSLIGTFTAMYFLGFSLNNLTIMALIIATGFVVDDAIVIIENVTRYIEQGLSPLQAALKGSSQIGFTILSLTVSLIAALIPLLFMSDVVGRLFREFAISLSITIVLSALISLSLTPMLCAKLLKLHQTNLSKANKFNQLAERFQNYVINSYERSLRWSCQHQRFITNMAIGVVIATGLLIYFIPKGFFPTQDVGIIQGFSEAPQAISFQAMSERQQSLVKIILQDPDVDNIASFIGIDGTNVTLNTGRINITLKPIEHRTSSAQAIINRLSKKLQAVQGIKLYMLPLQDINMDNRISRSQYQYSISAPEQRDVITWTHKLTDRLQQSPLLTDVTHDLQDLGLQTYISIDRLTAARLGITPQQIDDALYSAFGQRQVSTLFTQFNQYYVILETLPQWQNIANGFDNVYFKSIDNRSIALKTLTHTSQRFGPLAINRQNQFPVSIISFNLTPDTALGDCFALFSNSEHDLKTPAHLQTNFEGMARNFQKALANEGWLILASIVVIYLILGMLYESYVHPLTILSTLPSASLGALLALIVTGRELSVVALIGIILLIGIVMKNAIMMIDFALELQRNECKSSEEAIFQACMQRFRPILMTTLTSLLGAIPLAFSSGMGAELRQPLGITIIGGLFVSQLLTLYTVPITYLKFDALANKLYRLFGINPPVFAASDELS